MKRLLISVILGLSAACNIAAMELQPSYGQEKAAEIFISNNNAKEVLPLTQTAAKALLQGFDPKSNVPCQTLCTYLDVIKNSAKGEGIQGLLSSALDQNPEVLTPLLGEPTLIPCPERKAKISPNGAFICYAPHMPSASFLRYNLGGDCGHKHIIFYDCATKTTSQIKLPGKNNYVLGIKISKNSNSIYFLLKQPHAPDQLFKWDIASQSLSCILDGLQNTIMSSIKALSDDEKYIIITDENGCHLYNLETKQPVFIHPFNFSVLSGPKFKISSDNRLLAVQTSNLNTRTTTATLYDLLTQAVSFALPQNHRFGSFSPCNQKFLSCKDNVIYVWDTQTHTITNKIVYTDAGRIVGAKYISDTLLKVKYHAIDDSNQIKKVALLNLDSKKGMCIYDYSKAEERLSTDGAFSLAQLVNIQCGKYISGPYTAGFEAKCLHLTPKAGTNKYTCEQYALCSSNNEFFLTAKVGRAGLCIFDTHRRLTDGSSLESVLATLIALKQKKNNEPISNEIRALIAQGGNQHIQKIFAEPKPQEEREEEGSEYRMVGKQILYIPKKNKK